MSVEKPKNYRALDSEEIEFDGAGEVPWWGWVIGAVVVGAMGFGAYKLARSCLSEGADVMNMSDSMAQAMARTDEMNLKSGIIVPECSPEAMQLLSTPGMKLVNSMNIGGNRINIFQRIGH